MQSPSHPNSTVCPKTTSTIQWRCSFTQVRRSNQCRGVNNATLVNQQQRNLMECRVHCTTLWIGSYPFFSRWGDPVLPTAVVARIFHVMLMSVWDSHIFRIRKVIPIICFAHTPTPPKKKSTKAVFMSQIECIIFWLHFIFYSAVKWHQLLTAVYFFSHFTLRLLRITESEKIYY